MEWVYPYALEPGMTLGFLAPASSTKEDLQWITTVCESRGYHAVFAPSAYETGEYGGTPQAQCDEWHRFLADDAVHGIIALRGGYGTMRYLDLLDYAAFRQSRKPVVGFSDMTALHMAVNRHSRLITYHGPMGVGFHQSSDVDSLFHALEGHLQVINPLPEPPRGAIGAEQGDGMLRGGNMVLLSSLMGTHYGLEADSWEDTILLLEEVGEAPYRLDRMIQQLRLSGMLSRIKGVALGHMTDCIDEDSTEEYDIGGILLTAMEENRPSHLDDPFVCYVPAGHNSPNATLPLGGMVSFRYIANSMIIYPYTK